MPRKIKRTAFFVSDGTGLTAEALGYSLMTQFEEVKFKQIRITKAEKNDAPRGNSLAGFVDQVDRGNLDDHPSGTEAGLGPASGWPRAIGFMAPVSGAALQTGR
jgi:hypothetical protein